MKNNGVTSNPLAIGYKVVTSQQFSAALKQHLDKCRNDFSHFHGAIIYTDASIYIKSGTRIIHDYINTMNRCVSENHPQ